MYETFPDAAERKYRRDILFTSLSSFLDDFRCSGQGAYATPDDMVDLNSILEEIINLKFERDADGDHTVTFATNHNHHTRLISYNFPQYRCAEENDEQWLEDAMRAADFAAAMTADHMRIINVYQRQIIKKLKEKSAQCRPE